MAAAATIDHAADILIVGGGISGLSTALALHRVGIRSLVLEGCDVLSQSGFGITVWTNAWRALDALGVGDILRAKSIQIRGFEITRWNSGALDDCPPRQGNYPVDNCELRCLRRIELLQTLEGQLPKQSIRYSSKVVSIEESADNLKLVHLSDGSIFAAKVLIGCDGNNSVVSKWLGFQDPVETGRLAIRGSVVYPNGHGFGPKFRISAGGGLRCGFIPYDDNSLYWFCSFDPSMFKCKPIDLLGYTASVS